MLTTGHFKEALLSAAVSPPGLDNRTYSAYVPIADSVASVLVSLYEDLQHGCILPNSWTEAAVTFLPKRESALLEQHEWRPISLLNCIGKIFARATARQLLAKIAPSLHPAQCGFVPNKGTRHVLMNIEESALALGAQAPQSSLLLLDIAQAFPSLSLSLENGYFFSLCELGVADELLQAVFKTIPLLPGLNASHL